jgi:hypothetical protein
MKSENLVGRIFVLQLTLLFVGGVGLTFSNVLSGGISGIELAMWMFNIVSIPYLLYTLITKPESINPNRFFVGVMFFTLCALSTVGVICWMWIRRFPMDAGYLMVAIISLIMAASGIVMLRFGRPVKK